MTTEVLAHQTTAATQWSDTVLLVGVATAVCAGYLLGTRQLHGSAFAPRAWRSWRWRRYAFAAGVLVTVLSVLPALDRAADDSFVLHMTQHLVLMFLAAPLLAVGAPGLPLLLALPHRWRRRVAAVRSSAPGRQVRAVAAAPVFALTVYAVVVVGWHLPTVYTAALENDLVHEVEHAFFLLTAWLLWAPLASPDRGLDGGRGILYVFVSGFPMIGVGAALVMAPTPIYPAQTGTGPGALAAQQLAGVIMWVPPTFLSLFLVAALLLAWFRGMERMSPGETPLPPSMPPPLPGTVALLISPREVAR